MIDLLAYGEAKRLREIGEAAVLADPYNDYAIQFEKIAMGLAHADGEVTSDAVQGILPRPNDVHPNTVGAIFSKLVRLKKLKFVKYVPSFRRDRHTGKQGLYILGEKA